MTLQRLIVSVALAACCLAAQALPTLDAVQAEVQRGNYAQAETMMQEVVAAKPGSAKAHYIYAEILAHNRRFDLAASQAARAREADPTLKFADAAKFQAFESLLQREQQAAAAPRALSNAPLNVPSARPMARQAPAPEPASGIPSWVWVIGLAGVGFVVWRMVSGRRQATAMGSMAAGRPGMGPTGVAPAYAPGGMPGGAPGYGPGYGQPQAPGMGMMGVGLAAAGGVAAGMLAEKMLHGGHDSGSNPGQSLAAGNQSGGFFDNAPMANPAAQELEQRPVDFGNGDGWGGGDDAGSGGGSAGSSDDGW